MVVIAQNSFVFAPYLKGCFRYISLFFCPNYFVFLRSKVHLFAIILGADKYKADVLGVGTAKVFKFVKEDKFFLS